jgi:hypothetical protein
MRRLEPTVVRGFRVFTITPPEYDVDALRNRVAEDLDILRQLAAPAWMFWILGMRRRRKGTQAAPPPKAVHGA